jgi:hypothetical protein
LIASAAVGISAVISGSPLDPGPAALTATAIRDAAVSGDATVWT